MNGMALSPQTERLLTIDARIRQELAKLEENEIEKITYLVTDLVLNRLKSNSPKQSAQCLLNGDSSIPVEHQKTFAITLLMGQCNSVCEEDLKTISTSLFDRIKEKASYTLHRPNLFRDEGFHLQLSDHQLAGILSEICSENNISLRNNALPPKYKISLEVDSQSTITNAFLTFTLKEVSQGLVIENKIFTQQDLSLI